MFLKVFKKPGENLKKWTIVVTAIYDVFNVLTTAIILISATIENGIVGFVWGLIFGAIYFLLLLALTRFYYLISYCCGEITSCIKSIDEKMDRLIPKPANEEQPKTAVCSQEEKETRAMFCESCGSPISQNARFCNKCGSAIQ